MHHLHGESPDDSSPMEYINNKPELSVNFLLQLSFSWYFTSGLLNSCYHTNLNLFFHANFVWGVIIPQLVIFTLWIAVIVHHHRQVNNTSESQQTLENRDYLYRFFELLSLALLITSGFLFKSHVNISLLCVLSALIVTILRSCSQYGCTKKTSLVSSFHPWILCASVIEMFSIAFIITSDLFIPPSRGYDIALNVSYWIGAVTPLLLVVSTLIIYGRRSCVQSQREQQVDDKDTVQYSYTRNKAENSEFDASTGSAVPHQGIPKTQDYTITRDVEPEALQGSAKPHQYTIYDLDDNLMSDFEVGGEDSDSRKSFIRLEENDTTNESHLTESDHSHVDDEEKMGGEQYASNLFSTRIRVINIEKSESRRSDADSKDEMIQSFGSTRGRVFLVSSGDNSDPDKNHTPKSTSFSST